MPGLREGPGFYTPISSDNCPAYADRTLGPKVCPEYEAPGPRVRVHGQETPGRPQQELLLTCYEYVRERFGRKEGGEAEAAHSFSCRHAELRTHAMLAPWLDGDAWLRGRCVLWQGTPGSSSQVWTCGRGMLMRSGS